MGAILCVFTRPAELPASRTRLVVRAGQWRLQMISRGRSLAGMEPGSSAFVAARAAHASHAGCARLHRQCSGPAYSLGPTPVNVPRVPRFPGEDRLVAARAFHRSRLQRSSPTPCGGARGPSHSGKSALPCPWIDQGPGRESQVRARGEQIEGTYGHLLPDSLERTRTALDTFVAVTKSAAEESLSERRSGGPLISAGPPARFYSAAAN